MQDYFINPDLKSRFLFALGIGVFIFLFFLIFKPFNIDLHEMTLVRFSLGLGLLSFCVVTMFHVGYKSWWINKYDELEWKVYLEIILMSIMLICLGIVNYIYIEQPWINEWSILGMALHQLTTLAVGIFPIVYGILINQRHQQRKFYRSALKIKEARKNKEQSTSQNQTLTLKGSGDADRLSLDINQLSYIQASDNYVIVYHESADGSIDKIILRATMKSILQQLEAYSFILRAHKSFIVNLNKVEQVSGNSQGYKLHLRSIQEPIPVSRHLNKKVKEVLIGQAEV